MVRQSLISVTSIEDVTRMFIARLLWQMVKLLPLYRLKRSAIHHPKFLAIHNAILATEACRRRTTLGQVASTPPSHFFNNIHSKSEENAATNIIVTTNSITAITPAAF